MSNIAVIGIGKLGLCMALALESKGYNVVGIDVSSSYTKSLNDKKYTSHEPRLTELLLNCKNFIATTDLEWGIEHMDIILIYVQTPSTGSENNPYDCAHVSQTLSNINKLKIKNKHIVIGCTVSPGYTNQVGKYLLGECENVTLSYNPMFISQGNIVHGVLNPDVILIGEDTVEAGNVIEKLHQRLTDNEPSIERMSPESAEIAKLATNCFVTMKIAFANLIGDICDSTNGANRNQVLKCVGHDKRVGARCLQAGFGFGGPCLPRDNRAMNTHAKKVGINAELFAATDNENKNHLEFQVTNILRKTIPQSELDISNVSYKLSPVPIIEESQVLLFAEKLALNGRSVRIVDRQPVIDQVKMKHGNLFRYEAIQ